MACTLMQSVCHCRPDQLRRELPAIFGVAITPVKAMLVLLNVSPSIHVSCEFILLFDPFARLCPEPLV